MIYLSHMNFERQIYICVTTCVVCYFVIHVNTHTYIPLKQILTMHHLKLFRVPFTARLPPEQPHRGLASGTSLLNRVCVTFGRWSSAFLGHQTHPAGFPQHQ